MPINAENKLMIREKYLESMFIPNALESGCKYLEKSSNIFKRQDSHTASDPSFWQLLRQLLNMKMHFEMVRGYLTGEKA